MIYLSANGEVLGQFEESDLPSVLAAGNFPAEAHFWREGMPAWRPLRELVLPPQPRPFTPESKLKLAAPTGGPVARRPFVPRPRPQDAASTASPASPVAAEAATAAGSAPARSAPAVVRRTMLPRAKTGQEQSKTVPAPAAVPAPVALRVPAPAEPAAPAASAAPAESAPTDTPAAETTAAPEAVAVRPGLTPFVPGQKTFTPRVKAALPATDPVEAPAAPVVNAPRALRVPPPSVAPAAPAAPPAAPVPAAAPVAPPPQRIMAVDQTPRPGLGRLLRRAALIAALPLMAAAGGAAWWFWPARPPVLEGEVVLPGPDGAAAAVAGAEVFVVAQEDLAAQWRARLESAQGRASGIGESLARAKAVHREKELARELAVRISELGDEYNMPDAEQLRAESEAARAEEAAALAELEKLTLEAESLSTGGDTMLSAPEGRVQETATDETGRFTLPLPPVEQEGLVAFVLAPPPAGENAGPRGWLVPLEGAGQRTDTVRLSADNLLDLDQIRQIAGLSAP